jgi:hypothetical protein
MGTHNFRVSDDLNLPEAEHPEKKPLSYAYIRERRQEDDALLALLNKYPDN